MNTRVYAAQAYENFAVHSMGGHTDTVVGAFFEHNSMNVYSASKRGHLSVWECNQNTTDLVPKQPGKKKDATDDDSAIEDEGIAMILYHSNKISDWKLVSSLVRKLYQISV